VVLSAVIDPHLGAAPGIPHWITISFFALNVLGVTGTCYVLLHYFVRERDRAAAMVAAERERSEGLLLNILPGPIAERLKSGESLIADGCDDVGVLFADIAGFTPLSAALEPGDIVRLLNEVFTDFDQLAADRALEKIKTIGDAHGRRLEGFHRASDRDRHRAGRCRRDRRRKFSYDLWGDTVNTASRMESHGIPGAIQVTERARTRLDPWFEFEDRGMLSIKGKGLMRTFLLTGERPS
jgi:adenylate cyclase